MSRPSPLVARDHLATPVARLMQELRGAGPSTRSDLARATGLSAATVARSASALLEAGLVTERHDLTPAGAVGRPSTPLAIDRTHHVALAVHHGLATSTVAVVDLLGQVLTSQRLDHPWGAPFDADSAARRARDLLARADHRQPISAGLVAPWRDLDLDPHPHAVALSLRLGLHVRTADHVAAVAGAEYIHRRHGESGTTAYLYVRNAAGFVVAPEHRGRTEVSQVAGLTHFPLGTTTPCPCGHTGCFSAEVGDQALARRSGGNIESLYAAAGAGDPSALDLLAERAMQLGRMAAVVRDMTDPDRLVLVGQAFTGHPPSLGRVIESFRAHTRGRPLVPTFTRFGADVQAVAAGTVALAPVYDAPLVALGEALGGLPTRTGHDGLAG